MRTHRDHSAKIILIRHLLALLLLLWSTPVGAGQIRLDTSVETAVRNSYLTVRIFCTNRGDEAATHVRGEIMAAGSRLLMERRGTLPVGGTYRTVATVPLAGVGEGTHPVVVTVHYGDTNDRPFSALAVRTYGVGTTDPPCLVGTAEPIKIGGKGRLGAVFTNLAERAVMGRITLVLPRELQGEDTDRTFSIPARQRREISFVIVNLAALAGSTYPVYIIAQYDEGGRHHTAVIPTTVHIGEDDNPLGFTGRYVLLAVLVLLTGIFIAAQFTGREKKG